MSNALELRDLTHSYGNRTVLSGVSLTVAHQSIQCLMGPSGCGKTTILKIIAGLIRPGGGAVFIDGRDARSVPTHLRDIGFVFQAADALFPHLTVRQNIQFPFRHGGKKNAVADWKDETEKIMEITGLRPYARSNLAKLSGGLLQRVAIARALVYQPKILLLDEPLSSLDNLKKSELLDLIRKLRDQTGAAFLYVTHDDREVRQVGDRVAVLYNGAVVREGAVKDVFTSPRSSQVARLLAVEDNSATEILTESVSTKANVEQLLPMIDVGAKDESLAPLVFTADRLRKSLPVRGIQSVEQSVERTFQQPPAEGATIDGSTSPQKPETPIETASPESTKESAEKVVGSPTPTNS